MESISALCCQPGAHALVQVLSCGAHRFYLQQMLLGPFFRSVFPLLLCETPQMHHDFSQRVCSYPCATADKLIFNGKNPS